SPWFLGERARGNDWLSLAAIMVGMLLFFGDQLSLDGYLGNGVALAKSIDGVMLVADPEYTAPDAPAIAKIIADHINADYFELLPKLQQPDSRFVYLARRVPATLGKEVLDQIREHKFKGVDSRPDPVRYYPADDVAANLIGFLGEDKESDGKEKGQGGIERAFDRQLAGRDGKESFELASGNKMPLGENSLTPPVNGNDIQLTIDRDVQWYAQRVLRDAVQRANADSGSAVVLDSRTGEILALADFPTFDPNNRLRYRKADLGSRAVSDVYEPGSVEKVLTFASLLDANKVTPTTQISVPGELPVMDRVIHDYFDHGRLNLTATGVIAKSSNIGTVLAAERFSATQLWTYLKKFGLGQRTDIGLPGESRGLLPDPAAWSALSKANISFGQGVAVTALQMATAVNTIANDGERITPSLISGRQTNYAGQTVGTETASRHRVVSRSAAKQMSQMMEMVTTEGVGTAPRAGVVGYRVAGKTGTAQAVGGACNCYQGGGFDVSFGGFAPADAARFTVYVVVRHPQAGGASGGSTAGPVFHDIMNYVLQKYAVAPTGTPAINLPAYWGRGSR
ncbi:MAG TPA: penicillin-binding protein 2, partial [Marmoricola sp.]|nr:penicillin-binding protein 2 [Marmoricola sp.]